MGFDMLNNIKAVFIDIDGTLTDSKHQISNETIKAITRIREKGIYVILCSGRSNYGVCKFSKKTNASEFAISSNGAQIYNYTTKESIYKSSVSYTDLKNVWNYCKHKKLEIILNSENLQYGNEVFCSDLYKNKIVIEDISDIKKIDIYQVIINSNNFYDMKDFEKFIVESNNLKISNYCRDYLNNNTNINEPYYMFVNNISTDKGIAVKKFLEFMNIKKKETVCFGDRERDLSMFNNCGFKVAMENADDILKQKADYITLSNNENGVANFINKYL